MTFSEEIASGWNEPPRGDQINTWAVEVGRCARRLEDLRDNLPPEAITTLHDLFFEIGRLCRDAEGALG